MAGWRSPDRSRDASAGGGAERTQGGVPAAADQSSSDRILPLSGGGRPAAQFHGAHGRLAELRGAVAGAGKRRDDRKQLFDRLLDDAVLPADRLSLHVSYRQPPPGDRAG